MGGFFLTKDEIAQSVEHVFELFPRLRERANQRAGTMSGANSNAGHRPCAYDATQAIAT